MDYVQLHFDRPIGETLVLTFEAPPTVTTPRDETVRPRERGHADLLVTLIGGEVVDTVEAAGTELRIELTTGSVDRHRENGGIVSPEIAVLNGFADGQWMCWRPGEGSFQ